MLIPESLDGGKGGGHWYAAEVVVVWCVGVAAVLVADRRADGLASFTLEPGRNAGERGFGQEDGQSMAVRSVVGFPRTRRDSWEKERGAVPGVPWGCRVYAVGPPRTPVDANPGEG